VLDTHLETMLQTSLLLQKNQHCKPPLLNDDSKLFSNV